MARHIYPIYRFFVIIFLAVLPVSYCIGGGFTTNARLFVLMLITLFLFLPLDVQANDLFDSQMKLAKNGDAEAQFNIGEMYEIGFGVMQDKKQARYWISRSANQKHETAGFKLLYWNMERDGLKGKDMDKVKELNKMAKQGNKQAQYYLGKMYAHGVGINKNSDLAIDWLNKAALVGVLEADIELAYLREKKAQKKASLKNRFESDPCSSKSAKFLSTCR
jgi:TPR repeat protein